MTSGNVLFAMCTLLCLGGALTTVSSQNPIRGAMGLLSTIVGIAGLFLKLRAQFLTAIQLIVYAGAVVVLFVFVLMLLGAAATAPPRHSRTAVTQWLSGVAFVVIGLGAVYSVLRNQPGPTGLGPVAPTHGTVQAVGSLMFSDGIFAFELATALLLVAVIGAIAVARSKQGEAPARRVVRSPRDFFAGPLHPRDAQHPLGGSEPAE
jgi:NADH-quinone oxidoreductase subunit J